MECSSRLMEVNSCSRRVTVRPPVHEARMRLGGHAWAARNGAFMAINPLRLLQIRERHGSSRKRQSLEVVAGPSWAFNQRWRALRAEVEDRQNALKAAISATPVVQGIKGVRTAVQEQLEPVTLLYDWVRYWVVAWYNHQADWYNYFVREEAKRKWNWRNKYEKEWKFYKRLFKGTLYALIVAAYVTVMPFSLVLVVLPPLWLSWTWYENAFWSPIAFALYVMLPLKFPPGAPLRLLW